MIVDACTLLGRGGSPTAVFDDHAGLTDDARRDLVRRAGTSHGAFLDTGAGPVPAVRFFTADRELVNCGHGTVAAQAVLLRRSGVTELRSGQRTGGRVIATSAVQRADGIEVWHDQGVIDVRAATGHEGIVAALGLGPGDVAAGAVVASPGSPRLLLPVHTAAALHAIRPDLDRLAAACRRLGLLGCFVYTQTTSPAAVAPRPRTELPASGAVAAPADVRAPASGAARPDVQLPASGAAPADAQAPAFGADVEAALHGAVTGRMFAPAIGVGEDIVNANSAGCLAAALAADRDNGTTVHQAVLQGAGFGRPSLVLATATTTAHGIEARVGGVAVIRG